jgi:hypothetical protein
VGVGVLYWSTPLSEKIMATTHKPPIINITHVDENFPFNGLVCQYASIERIIDIMIEKMIETNVSQLMNQPHLHFTFSWNYLFDF